MKGERTPLPKGISETSDRPLKGRTILVLIVLCSCLRVEQIEELNSAPRILLNKMEHTVVDSVKLTKSEAYAFDLEVTDPDDNLELFSYEIFSGSGILFQNGQAISRLELINEPKIIPFSYQPNQIGTHLLVFNIQDSFGQTSSITLDLLAFTNIPPVAQFTLIKPAIQYDPLEYLLDASSSYDPDETFGGGIIEYEYSFLDKTVKLSKSTIGIIFPESGTYEVSLKVIDNDGEESEEVKLVVEV